ncbi:AAA family ATPase [Ralstonia wenshanensis]|uniref:hypothetical protein n=1 Tax=Ralstonia wenshanensis TaxID=2842456 RepID=UPI002AAE87A3|nr:hypothetical protein [Ralstonia wenshanensis]MDY7511400.1 hypothetical protein [Ralstonia wenshanensis]
MIEKFVSDERAIRLRNSRISDKDNVAVPEENIFSIDSLSLIIGDNGSGKTRTLEAIIESMCGPSKEAWSLEWRPVFLDNLDDRYGVVYFSQAPNRPPKRRGYKNFIDASPSSRRNYPPESMFDHEQLLRDVIKRDTRFLAEMRADPRKLLGKCVELVLAGELEKLSQWHRVRHDFQSLKHHYAQLGESESIESKLMTGAIRRLQQSGAQIPIRGLDPEFDRHCDDVVRRLHDEIFNTLGNYETLAFFIALDYCVRVAERPTDILVSAFSMAISGMRHARATLPQERAGLFQAHYIRVLDVLEQWGNRLQTVRTANMSFKVTYEIEHRGEVTALRHSPLDKIVKVGWKNVSSGQWALVTQCIEIERAIRQIGRRHAVSSLLVLIDEGDAFLHLEWQRQYIHIIDGLLARLKQELGLHCLQAIIATHSPMLATDVPSPYVNRMRDDRVMEQCAAFAAPLQTLLNNSFEARSIGEHAAVTIRKTIKAVQRSGKPTARDLYVASIVDDPIIRRELRSLFDKRQGDAR